MNANDTKRLAALDHAHVWHPFTPMKQWREQTPLIIERAENEYLIDTEGKRYIDGVSSLWCNVHGHRVPEIDDAVRQQLDKVAHTTLLGLASPPSIELAAMLADRAPGKLTKTFYSDAGATALEVAFKVAVGYWYHRQKPEKHRFIGLAGAYHGDTTGAMSIGYSELFHRPFLSMVFPTTWFPNPDPCRPPQAVGNLPPRPDNVWPSEHQPLADALTDYCLGQLDRMLREQAHETAAIVIEPVMQGAAGMVCQPPGFVKGVADLARKYEVLLIADEVATGFGRTGKMFAVEHDLDENFYGPDILCLAKGISAGYLPLAATMVTDEIDEAFTGELADRRTLYHGHTYTGNPLACAAAVASLKRFDDTNLIEHINQSAEIIADRLAPLRDPEACPHVLDIRQRGIMVGIELCEDRNSARPFDFAARRGYEFCAAVREKGVIIRPLGDVVILMPIPAMSHASLEHMLDTVVETFLAWRPAPASI
ncbi:adenosylmethionine--8-amino-7-oxononanoate transaminase [Phycisphaerales bacterium AB-hyl4]|uniref:Adenosylmethionine-8-amino-7-oxononanoate aminotransferase n=1 Tax=Natronomicrosphaera hydrolytica TaxID=3242702 RepID=A0ABV4U696_9BACT